MAERQPIAFLSYVRSDDDHDEGRITAFRQRLEGEVRMQTGKPFAIFQDRNDILWGQHWEDRINNSLLDVTFLIPVLTPSFFQSPACRAEFKAFLLKEKMLGVNRLILPLYYVSCDELTQEFAAGIAELADTLRKRNWTDWRLFRFKSFNEESVAAALAQIAGMVKASIKELHLISIAAAKPEGLRSKLPPPTVVQAVAQKALQRDADDIAKKHHTFSNTDVFEARPKGSFDKKKWNNARFPAYYAYTKRFDEVVNAEELADAAELSRLYSYLSSLASPLKEKYSSRLASRLSQFQLSVPSSPLAVLILVDNSGSMRGSKISNTASWCLLIAEWMDRLRIPTEILGYTTRAWKGGQSRELWLSDHKPTEPGRLNDLRHLIYKSFSTGVEASALNFGLMLREGLLKENIDGEALLWAASRLEVRPERERILFVFSDGASVDDSTLAVNPGDFLERHHKQVVASISKNYKLYAIGLENDVSIYYPNTVMVKDTKSLGVRFFEMLIKDPAFKRSWHRQELASGPDQAQRG